MVKEEVARAVASVVAAVMAVVASVVVAMEAVATAKVESAEATGAGTGVVMGAEVAMAGVEKQAVEEEKQGFQLVPTVA